MTHVTYFFGGNFDGGLIKGGGDLLLEEGSVFSNITLWQNTRQNIMWAGGVLMHYSNAAAAALQ